MASTTDAPSRTAVAADPAPAAHARAVLMLQQRPGQTTLDEECLLVALHGRGIETLLLPPPPAEGAGDTQWQHRADACLRQVGAVGLCLGRQVPQLGVVSAVQWACRCGPRLAALAVLGSDLGRCRQADMANLRVPLLVVVGAGELDSLPGGRRACRLAGAAAELVQLPPQGHAFASTSLGDRKAELAADWFDRHLSVA